MFFAIRVPYETVHFCGSLVFHGFVETKDLFDFAIEGMARVVGTFIVAVFVDCYAFAGGVVWGHAIGLVAVETVEFGNLLF